jgi:hypothetical protein
MEQAARRPASLVKPEELPADRSTITDTWLTEQTRLATELAHEFARPFQSTRLADALREAELQGGLSGDHYLKTSGTDQRPMQVDPYLWRDYYIAMMKYHYVKDRLEGFRSELDAEGRADFIARLQKRIALRRDPSS